MAKKIYVDPDGLNEYHQKSTEEVDKKLNGDFVENNEFTFRATDGITSIKTGTAYLERIKGNTVKWNQLYDKPNNNYTLQGSVGSKTISGDEITVNTNSPRWRIMPTSNGVDVNYDNFMTSGHKYMFLVDIKSSNGGETIYIGIMNTNGVARFGGYTTKTVVTNSYVRYGIILRSWNYESNYSAAPCVGSNVSPANNISCKNFNLIDLTLMYGEGNEPSTIAQFEADYFKWFGKPLTSEAYTEGELRDVKMSGIKTIGFNQWDEEWEAGGINPNTGGNVGSGIIRSKNYIPIFPNTTYFYKCPHDTSNWIVYYDENKQFIGNYGLAHSNAEFETPSNAHYMRFSQRLEYGKTYNHDICINLSHSGKRNGEYEPHWEETKNVPITTLTGKLNGEGESVIVFPDGMKSVGEVQDEILIENGGTNGIKRIGGNDLGDYNYTKQGNLYTTDFVPANTNMISGRGKSVVWNQLVTLFNNTKWTRPSFVSVSDGVLTLNAENINYPGIRQNFNGAPVPIIGHKYLIKIEAKGTTSGRIAVGIGDTNYTPTAAILSINASPANWTVFSAISQITSTTTGSAVIQGRSLGMTVNMQFRNFVIFDLTLMFGAGKEPSSVEEFRAMFPEDYYVYNAGSLGIVADATYPDAATFKTAMNGVMLYYELATPLIYELDNFQLPLPYRVDDYGTEEIKGAENSVAPILDIRYGINIVDTIRNLPKTIDSIKTEISDANDRIDDAFDAIGAKEDKLAFSHSTSEVPPSTALTFTPNVNTIYYQHESTPLIGNINMVLPVPTTERATIKVIYRNSTADAPTITSAEGVNVIIESNIGGPYRLTTINCEWYHDCWVVDIKTHGT